MYFQAFMFLLLQHSTCPSASKNNEIFVFSCYTGSGCADVKQLKRKFSNTLIYAEVVASSLEYENLAPAKALQPFFFTLE